MFTNRRTHVIKRGKMQEAIALVKTSGFPPDRIYGSGLGSGYLDSLILEWDYESMAVYERDTLAFVARPAYTTHQAQLNELTDTGGHCEILHRHQ